MALCVALFNPALEVVAVTAVGGNVPPQLATRNVQAIIERIDPPRWPRTGAASPPDNGLPVHGRHLHGIDGLGGIDLRVAELRSPHPSEKIIADEIRAAPEAVTLVALGPLTNVARALQRDPAFASLLGRVGNHGRDRQRARQHHARRRVQHVLRPRVGPGRLPAPATKTLIPLDLTNRVVLTYDLFNRLPDENSKIGSFLRQSCRRLPCLSPGVRPGRDPRPRLAGLDVGDPSRAVHHGGDGRQRGNRGRADPGRAPSSTAAASRARAIIWKWPWTCRRRRSFLYDADPPLERGRGQGGGVRACESFRSWA